MPPARSSSSSNNSTLIAMIIFILLFLISTVIAVMQFMKNEQIRRNEQAAINTFKELATQNEYNQVKFLVKKRGDDVQTTAMTQITNDMRHMAELLAGEAATDVELIGTRSFADNEVARIKEQVADILRTPEGEPLIAVDTADERFIGMVNVSEQLLELLSNVNNAYAQLLETLDTQAINYETTIEQMEGQMAQLNEQLAVASKAAQTAEENYSALQNQQVQSYERLIGELNAKADEIKNQLNELQDKNQNLLAQKDGFESEVKKLRELLKEYRPLPDREGAAIEPDGYVISVVPHDNLAYINLNNTDSIYRGLTFSVYDSYQEIPKSGKGKGSLEVLEMFDTISKCRITDFDQTNPIMEKDVIANLVWNKDTQYLFCVAGDFDFDQDGQIDPEGRLRVESLIASWGGQADTSLSVDTDFLVLGHAPFIPNRPSEEDMDNNTDKARAYENAIEKAAIYNEILADSASLGVPTFNLDRFLYFIGYYQQAKSPL